MLTEAGHDNAADAAQRIYDLEKQLAEHHWTRLEIRDAEARYNKMTIDEVRALMGGIDYDAVATLSGVDHAEYIIVNTPSYIEALGQNVQRRRPANLERLPAKFVLLGNFASRLHSPHRRYPVFDFYSTTLSGTPEQQ